MSKFTTVLKYLLIVICVLLLIEYYTREPVKSDQIFEEETSSKKLAVTKSEKNVTIEHLRNNYREYAKTAHLGKIHPKHLILESNRADCNHQENIVFLKTHKTASSTIQNIFFRYGLKNSLRFALPEKGWKSHLLGYPSPFQRSFLQQPEKTPNILTNHVRFSSNISSTIKNAKYISILRDPIGHFVSTFEYFHHIGVFNSLDRGEKGLYQFFKDPFGYYQNDTRWGKWLAKNINFFDLGYSNELTDQSEVNTAIDEIMKQFDFIMISDYMEESLILLKEELCLQTSDIVFFSINKRSSNKSAELPNDLRQSIKSWNNADFELFDRVNKTFWSRVINFGLDRMEKEKKILNDQINIWMDYCVANISTITQNDLRQKWKKKIKSDPRMLNTTIQQYNLTPEGKKSTRCKFMTLNEHEFSIYIWKKQNNIRLSNDV